MGLGSYGALTMPFKMVLKWNLKLLKVKKKASMETL